MTTPTFEDAVSRIVRKDPRFAERAYSFLKDAQHLEGFIKRQRQIRQ